MTAIYNVSGRKIHRGEKAAQRFLTALELSAKKPETTKGADHVRT